jgi:hypothetical protein
MSDKKLRDLERQAQQDPNALRALLDVLLRLGKLSEEEYRVGVQILSVKPRTRSHQAVLTFLELINDGDSPAVGTVLSLARISLAFLFRYLADPYSDVRPSTYKYDSLLDEFLTQLDEDEFESDGDGENSRLYDFGEPGREKLRLFDRLSIAETRRHLTAAEVDLLVRSAGAIFHERNDGIVNVSWISNRDELLSRWTDVQISYQSDDDLVEEDDDEESCARCSAPVAPPETYLDENGVCNLCVEGDE